MTTRRFEISSSGIDEYLQNLGGDPFGGSAATGMRVPTLPTPDFRSRYLFNGASFTLGVGAKAKIVGFRQLVTIGCAGVGVGGAGNPRFVEQAVESELWRFPDGNVNFFLRALGDAPRHAMPASDRGQHDLDGFRYGWSDTSALLYDNPVAVPSSYYVNLTQYTPPNKGEPWGQPLSLMSAGVLDLRGHWTTSSQWGSLSLPVEGPDTFSAMISVHQTNPATRTALNPPSPLYQGGLGKEELFLLNFPNAIYWRVGVSLFVEVYDGEIGLAEAVG